VVSRAELNRLPTVEELENLSTDQLDDLLGLKPQYDIPPAARRSLDAVGIVDLSEGGMPTAGVARQPAQLVRAVLAGTKGPLVSRWGHILLRRTLASRMAPPQGLDPVDFAALRADVLNSMGEFAAARALVQDVDTGNWNTALTSVALTSYIASSDLVGACPAVRLQTDGERDDPRWLMLQAICNAFAGEGALASSQLNAAQGREIASEIDLLLAQRYAGAANAARGGAVIEWEGVDELTPWRFALATAVGEAIPEDLREAAGEGTRGRYYALAGAAAPALSLPKRLNDVAYAAGAGVFSSSAYIDILSQIYADNAIGGAPAERAADLRAAYVAAEKSERIAAMRRLWDALEDDGADGYAGRVLTAYAAARIAPSSSYGDAAGELITSMLAAGLDRDAASWRAVVADGSLGWALIALADPDNGTVDEGALDDFLDDDESAELRKSAFLVAGLAGLGRLDEDGVSDLADRLDVDLDRETRWTRTITRAARFENTALVALLAGLGMQGESWTQMTPLHLFHITRALRISGLEAEARMIAAEAVARG
jgi:hypothetical protein